LDAVVSHIGLDALKRLLVLLADAELSHYLIDVHLFKYEN